MSQKRQASTTTEVTKLLSSMSGKTSPRDPISTSLVKECSGQQWWSLGYSRHKMHQPILHWGHSPTTVQDRPDRATSEEAESYHHWPSQLQTNIKPKHHQQGARAYVPGKAGATCRTILLPSPFNRDGAPEDHQRYVRGCGSWAYYHSLRPWSFRFFLHRRPFHPAEQTWELFWSNQPNAGLGQVISNWADIVHKGW